jgi:hypothetical protein
LLRQLLTIQLHGLRHQQDQYKGEYIMALDEGDYTPDAGTDWTNVEVNALSIGASLTEFPPSNYQAMARVGTYGMLTGDISDLSGMTFAMRFNNYITDPAQTGDAYAMYSGLPCVIAGVNNYGWFVAMQPEFAVDSGDVVSWRSLINADCNDNKVATYVNFGADIVSLYNSAYYGSSPTQFDPDSSNFTTLKLGDNAWFFGSKNNGASNVSYLTHGLIKNDTPAWVSVYTGVGALLSWGNGKAVFEYTPASVTEGNAASTFYSKLEVPFTQGGAVKTYVHAQANITAALELHGLGNGANDRGTKMTAYIPSGTQSERNAGSIGWAQSASNSTYCTINAENGGTVAEVFRITGAGALQIIDGITAPATRSGYASIYVDTADGDLKIKYGDGTVKTIVVDT